MRKIRFVLLTFLLAGYFAVYAQVPEKIKYQAVIRNSSNEIVDNQNVSVNVNVLNETSSGEILYSETHTLSTNAYGQISFEIGGGNDPVGNISSINWGDGDKYLNVEVDAGSGYIDMGTIQILSVPYAFYANSADSARVAGIVHFSDNSNYADSSRIAGIAYIADFADSARVASMAYTASVAEALGSDGVYSTNTDTLFVVKDHSGNVVFAVFPDGAQIIVNETAKGKVGGFAVSGRSPSKAGDIDILKITADSTRIYVNDTVTTKGKVGGFAVSGRSPSKNLSTDILFVTADSTRVFVNESTEAKGKVGGFAVSGRSPGKGSNDYFNVSGSGSSVLEIINPSEPRMLWYPNSEAFLVGRVLVEHPDSVGLNSLATGFESKAIGDYSQALGYQSIARENYSTAIGKNAVAAGESSYAIGDMASTDVISTSSYALGSNAYAKGASSYAIGNGAISTGNGSFAFGAGGRDSSGVALVTTTESVAPNSFAMGLGAKSMGLNSFSIGTGTVTTSTGENALAMGFGSIASGRYAVALGYRNMSSGVSSMSWGGVRSGTSDYTNTASGRSSTAFGFKTTASGFNSTSWGANSNASGWNATTWGAYTVASGYCATAWGSNSKALKDYNTAWLGGKALGYHTTAVGEGIVANVYKSFVFGRANDTCYSHSDINYYDNISPWSYIGWYDDDPLFVIGNGWDHPAVGKRNALTVLKDATTIIGWDNTVKSDASNPDTAFVNSVKVPRDNGFLFYVHGKAGGPLNWVVSSDARLKQNIETIDGALDKVLKLRGVSFDWKNPEMKGRQLGFIAQEAIEVIPEVVNGSESTNYSMQYAPITAVLVEAMKEQQTQIEELKTENEILKQKLNEIIELLGIK